MENQKNIITDLQFMQGIEENNKLAVPDFDPSEFLNIIDKPFTKSDIADKAKYVQDMINEGYISPVDVIVNLKIIKEFIDATEKLIKADATDAATRYKGELFKGCKLEIRSLGGRTNYNDDTVYKDLQNKLKERENLLKAAIANKDSIIFDTEGAEVPKVSVVSGKDTLVITMQK